MSRFIYTLATTSLFLLVCGRTQNFQSSSSTGQQQVQPPTLTAPSPVPRPSTASNLTVCAHHGVTNGTDVSDYDPNTQWGAVRNGGYQFAFIKATEGSTFKNSLFNSDWAAALSSGVIRGAYHFFHPGDDPKAQAQFFLATIGPLRQNDLPPVLDWEVTDGVSVSTQIQNAQIWLQQVEAATGKTPMIYVDPSFWNQLGNPQEFVHYPLYIANYGVNCPSIPPPWSTWAFWQTGIGSVPGLQSVQADLDVFNGILSAPISISSLQNRQTLL